MRIDRMEARIAELDAADVERVLAAVLSRRRVLMNEATPTIDCERCGATVSAEEAGAVGEDILCASCFTAANAT